MATTKVWLGIANEGVAELRFTSKLASMKGNLSKGDIKNGFVVVDTVDGGGRNVVVGVVLVVIVAAVVVLFVVVDIIVGSVDVVLTVVDGWVVGTLLVAFLFGVAVLVRLPVPVRFVDLSELASTFVPFIRSEVPFVVAAPAAVFTAIREALPRFVAIAVGVLVVFAGLEVGL